MKLMVKPNLPVATERFGNTQNKDLGKVFAHNSHDFLRVKYKIRQTYAVCLIFVFMRRVTLWYTPWRRRSM